ncbi:hypothetical protein [Streptomyces buecherae]
MTPAGAEATGIDVGSTSAGAGTTGIGIGIGNRCSATGARRPPRGCW